MPKVLLLLLLLVAQVKSVWADANAAEVYRQAFALLEPLSDEEAKLLKNGSASEPGAPATKALLEKHAEALALFVKATALPECDWELNYGSGLEHGFPHLKPMAVLIELLKLRADLAFREGRSEAAMADHLAGVRANRHATSVGRTIPIGHPEQDTMEATSPSR